MPVEFSACKTNIPISQANLTVTQKEGGALIEDLGCYAVVQGSPNFFVRGPHKLIQNMSRAGRLT